MTSPTEEETNEILEDISSSLSDTSAIASNFASAAELINNLTLLMDNVTVEQLEVSNQSNGSIIYHSFLPCVSLGIARHTQFCG